MKSLNGLFRKITLIFLVIKHFLSRYKKRLANAKQGYKQVKSPKKHLLTRLFFSNWFYIFLFFLMVAGVILTRGWAQLHEDSTISIGVVGFYNNRNLPPVVANLLSEPLIDVDGHGSPKANLAASWQVSTDSAHYVVSLRKGLYWGDGTPVKSSDIKINLPDVAVTYPDDSTIDFKLSDSFSPFLSLLNTPIFKDGTLLGIGQFEATDVEESHDIITKLVLEPRKSDFSSVKNISKVVIRFYPDENTAHTAFELGEIDGVWGISSKSDYSNYPEIGFKDIENYNKLTGVFYNATDPVLSDKNFRHALNCATPQVIGEEWAKTSIPSSSWAFNDNVKDCVNDLATAKSYFDKVQNGKDSTITLTATPSLASLGESIVNSWKKLGIKAVLRTENGIPQNYQALLISQTIPLDPDQYLLWHSTQTKTNLSHLDSAQSKRIDKDLEEGRKSSDINVRKENYADLQRVLAEEAVADFLYFPKTTVVYRQKVGTLLDELVRVENQGI